MMPWDSAYASSYFTITGFHMMHVVVGLIVLAALLWWSALGKFGEHRHAAVSIGALYWHFVDVVWLAVFFTLYVTPHLA
jgi:heme/copper-type cytochrome/quinol oxidase subunit 3